MFQVQTTVNTLTSSYDLVDVAPSNEGIYTCFATNSYSNASYSVGIIVLPPVVASVADYWYIFLIIGLIILFVLIAVFAFYYHRHNVGESYPGNYIHHYRCYIPARKNSRSDNVVCCLRRILKTCLQRKDL
jgi:hypothetical protein